jgi:hypothetical protein
MVVKEKIVLVWRAPVGDYCVKKLVNRAKPRIKEILDQEDVDKLISEAKTNRRLTVEIV